MKKGYNVILYLTHRETVEIETEEENEEKIMDEARLSFIDEIRGTGDADDIIGDIEPVKIERNHSESTDEEFKDWVKGKPFEVHYSSRSGGLSVTVNAVDEIEAELEADEILETYFTSEDGLTTCEVEKYEFFDVWDLEEVKKADEAAMDREHQRIDEAMKNAR